MKGKKASNNVMQGKARMKAGKCKNPSKKVRVLWLVVVPKCQRSGSGTSPVPSCTSTVVTV